MAPTFTDFHRATGMYLLYCKGGLKFAIKELYLKYPQVYKPLHTCMTEFT